MPLAKYFLELQYSYENCHFRIFVLLSTQGSITQKTDCARLAENILIRISSRDTIFASLVVKDYYDAIHSFAEAISIEKGWKFSGDGAHRELLDFVAKERHLSENHRVFLQELRDFRNRILCEGFELSKEYLLSKETGLKNIIELLK